VMDEPNPFSPYNGCIDTMNETEWPGLCREFEQARDEAAAFRWGDKVQRIKNLATTIETMEKMIALLHYEKRQTIHEVVFFGERGTASRLAREMNISRQRVSDVSQKAAYERLAGMHPLQERVASQVQ
jgi:hypothetical protein